MAETNESEVLLQKIKTSTEESLNEAQKKFEEKLQSATKGLSKEEEVKSALELSAKEIEELKAKIKEIGGKDAEIKNVTDILAKQGNEINKLKEIGLVVQGKKKATTKKEWVAKLLDSIMFTGEIDENGKPIATDALKEAMSKNFAGSSIQKSARDFETKATVAVSTDHTGDIFITDPRLQVRDIPLRQTHIRDLMAKETTEGTQITAPEVYDYTDAFTAGAQMLDENGQAPETSFKTKENTWTLKRIAVSMIISKRYFKTNGLKWVRDHLINRLPDQIQRVEDFQLLFGDGSGNNVDGLTRDAQQFDLTPNTYVATNFSSVATYEGGTKALVTFAIPHNLRNGDNLTIANSTNYNATYNAIIVVNQYSVIINAAYVSETATAWTGTGTSYWYQTTDNAQEFDVLSVGKALLQSGEYSPTGIVLHPNDVERLGLLKGTDAHYVGVSRDAAGRLNVNALPIAVTSAMPAGHFLIGDFQRAVALAEYTPLTIQLAEDVETKQKNEVVIIAEEEFIMPKYNPFWFLYGRFEDAKAEIEA